MEERELIFTRLSGTKIFFLPNTVLILLGQMGESRLKELVWEVSQELSKQSELLHRKRQELEEQKRESDAARATLVVEQDAAKALIDLQRRTFETEMKKQREEVGMELDIQRQNATK